MFGAAYMRSGYNGPELLHLVITLWDYRSFIEQPAGVKFNRAIIVGSKLAYGN